LKKALAYYNNGVVAVNLKIVGLAPGYSLICLPGSLTNKRASNLLPVCSNRLATWSQSYDFLIYSYNASVVVG
jgi:hypothetical protein